MSGIYCSYVTCRKNSADYPLLQMYKFPKTKLRQKWIINSGNKLDEDNKFCDRYVCERHFSSASFTSPLRNRLVPKAVPISCIQQKPESECNDKNLHPQIYNLGMKQIEEARKKRCPSPILKVHAPTKTYITKKIVPKSSPGISPKSNETNLKPKSIGNKTLDFLNKKNNILNSQQIKKTPSTASIDEYQIFGNFVASELRNMRLPKNKQKLKLIIQKAIVDISELDDEEYDNKIIQKNLCEVQDTTFLNYSIQNPNRADNCIEYVYIKGEPTEDSFSQ